MDRREETVLIVDDEPDTAWALEHLLRRWGIHSQRVLTGQAALQQVRQHPFTLALVDAKLLDMDGLELARQMRALDSALPIILISGYFYKDDPAIQQAQREGWIQDFIAKPFLHEDLLRAVACLSLPGSR